MLLFPTNYFISSHYKIFLPALYRRRRCVQLVVLTHIYFHMKMYEHLFWDAVNSKQSQSCHSSFSPRILHNEKTIDQTHTQKDGSSFFFQMRLLFFVSRPWAPLVDQYQKSTSTSLIIASWVPTSRGESSVTNFAPQCNELG